MVRRDAAGTGKAFALGTLLACVAAAATASDARDLGPAEHAPLISIIIDDLGYDYAEGLRALGLPEALTYSVLPHTPYGVRLANLAHVLGKEVLLHLPMASVSGQRLGPGGLTPGMTQGQLEAVVADDLAAVPYARGVNNHMGSLLTGRYQSMRWLMAALRTHGDLFFVDSRTTARSVAYRVARTYRVPAARRDVFLDDQRDSLAILRQLHRLIRVATRKGAALGIAHPNPETLDVLRAVLPQLAARGVKLVPVSVLVQRRPRPPQPPATRLVRSCALPPAGVASPPC
jgi:polysaccharide deacetylase 2 family uncharacterized protein YibQ